MFVRAYLRASIDEQDANRARVELENFCATRGLTIACWYVENESDSTLHRPELFRLLADTQPGDVLLVEQVDRLSLLTEADWNKLKAQIAARHVRVVANDLPTSWMMLTASRPDEFTGRMLKAFNSMLLDMLAVVARKDYEDRRRQVQAKAEGCYKGRPADEKRHRSIRDMLSRGMSWFQVMTATQCSRTTVAAVAKSLKPAASAVASAG